jgi:hypothetical protein
MPIKTCNREIGKMSLYFPEAKSPEKNTQRKKQIKTRNEEKAEYD